MLTTDVAAYCSRIHFSGGDAHQHQSDALQDGRQDAQTPGIAELVICKTLKIMRLNKSFAGIFGPSFQRLSTNFRVQFYPPHRS